MRYPAEREQFQQRRAAVPRSWPEDEETVRFRAPAKRGHAFARDWAHGDEDGFPERAVPDDAPRRFEPADDPRPARGGRGLAFSLLFVASAALGGAALSFPLAGMFPRSFTATAVVGVEKDAALDAMTARLGSGENLDRIASSLDLAREPLLAAGTPGPLAVTADLLAGTERTASPPTAALQRALADTLSATPDRQAGRLSLAVTTPSPVLSVRIANAFAHEGVNHVAAQALDDAHGLTAAREAAEEAERALADFIAAGDASELDAASRLSAEIVARDADVAAREAELATLKEESARIGAARIEDIAAGTVDFGTDAPAFADARRKYAVARLELDRLSADLGPRHPRLLAARSAATEARNQLQDALRRLDAGYKEKVGAATRALDEAKAARAKLDSGSSEGREGLETYETLKREAERLRADYLDKVDISRAAPPPPAPARVVVPAGIETTVANGVSPLLMAVAGAAAGLLLAVAWLFLRPRRDRDDEPATLEAVDAAFEAGPHADWRPEDDDGYDEDRAWYDEEDDDEWGPPPAVNDDLPLAERLRAVLRRSAEMDEREAMRAEDSGRQAELEEIRRRMAALRQRLEAYGANRAVEAPEKPCIRRRLGS